MKVTFASVTITAVASMLLGTASAAEITVTSPKGCGIWPPLEQAAIIHATQNLDKTLVSVQVTAICGATPHNPKIELFRNIARISVEYDYSSSVHNCRCVRTLYFAITSLPPETQTLYYVSREGVLGHAGTP